MLVLFAVCLPIFIVMIVLSVDIAFMQLTRTELRTATDAAARAGSRTLSLAQDAATAIAVTKAAAARPMHSLQCSAWTMRWTTGGSGGAGIAATAPP